MTPVDALDAGDFRTLVELIVAMDESVGRRTTTHITLQKYLKGEPALKVNFDQEDLIKSLRLPAFYAFAYLRAVREMKERI